MQILHAGIKKKQDLLPSLYLLELLNFPENNNKLVFQNNKIVQTEERRCIIYIYQIQTKKAINTRCTLKSI